MGKSKVETKSESVLQCVLLLGVFPRLAENRRKWVVSQFKRDARWDSRLPIFSIIGSYPFSETLKRSSIPMRVFVSLSVEFPEFSKRENSSQRETAGRKLRILQ